MRAAHFSAPPPPAYLAPIIKEEPKNVSMEIKGRPMGVCYDGTMQDGKATVVVVRFVGDEMHCFLPGHKDSLVQGPLQGGGPGAGHTRHPDD